MDSLLSDYLLEGALGNATDYSNATSLPVMPVGPGVDKGSCQLLGTTGLIVQGILAIIVLGTLVVKRFKESPRRSMVVWGADVSKQVIGQGFLHSSNILVSTLMAHHDNRDACTAYWLSILVDCTLGILIIYATMQIFAYILITKLHLPGFRTGKYYPSKEGDQDPSHFQFSWWSRQLLVYLLTLFIMKLAILGFFWIDEVFVFGDWLLSWFGEEAKLVFVLMIFPLMMNLFQFLVIDAILKQSQPKLGLHSKEERSNAGNDNGEDSDDENQAFLNKADERRQEITQHDGAQDRLPTHQRRSASPSKTHSSTRSNTQAALSPQYPPEFVKRASTPVKMENHCSPRLANRSLESPAPSSGIQRRPSAVSESEKSAKDEGSWDWLEDDSFEKNEPAIAKQDVSLRQGLA